MFGFFEGLIRDPLALLNERKHRNIWTEKERRIFKDKYVLKPFSVLLCIQTCRNNL